MFYDKTKKILHRSQNQIKLDMYIVHWNKVATRFFFVEINLVKSSSIAEVTLINLFSFLIIYLFFQARRKWGVKLLTLFQPEGQIMPTTVIQAPRIIRYWTY